MNSERTSDGFPTDGATEARLLPDAVYKCNSKECGAYSLGDDLTEGGCRCGASVHTVRDVSSDQFYRLMIRNVDDKRLELRADVERLTTERDEARAEVERLKKLVTMHEATTLLLETGRDSSQRRIAALEAVITRQAEMIVAQERHSIASLRLAAAYADAGLPFGPYAAKDVPVLAEPDAAEAK